jgi:hypothetical protein
MKMLSGAVVVLAGAIAFGAGAMAQVAEKNRDLPGPFFGLWGGGALAIIGLYVMWKSYSSDATH